MFAQLNNTLTQLYDLLIKGKEPDKSLTEEVMASLRVKKNRIYGAGRAGKMLKRSFANFGIPIDCFVDRHFSQIGSVEEIPVVSPVTLKGIAEPEAGFVIIAAGTMQLAELIEEDLAKLECTVPTINGLFLVYLLQYLTCKSRHEKGEAPDIRECTAYHVKPYKCPVFCRHMETLAFNDNPCADATGSSFNEFGYLLSEVCTLKCKHCLEAVPYLKSKEILPKDVILKDIRKMVNACRFLHRLDLVGGEPFLHPEITSLVADIRKIERIGYIGVFTNGTVVPSDELCRTLKSERIIVTIANYGQALPESFRDKIAATIEKLHAFNVQHFHYSDRYWFDINSFEPQTTDAGRLEANYANCFLAACRRMYNGMLFHCPYQCNGVKLGKLAQAPGQYIDIHSLTDADLSAELDRFEEVKFIDACRYCNIPVGAREVTAGEQL